MKHTSQTRVAAFGLLLGAALALTGCSLLTGSGGSASPSVVGTLVTVSEDEYSIALSQNTFTPGTYTFAVTNDGGTQHDLVINGPGVTNVETSVLAPNQTASLTVRLEPGRYELWSSISDDKLAGIDLWITVR